MTIIAQRLEPVAIGKKQHFKNLTMFPLVDENPHEARYLLLEEALKSGHARATEVSEGGALAVGERIIHLCAFRLAESKQENLHRGSRMVRASVRRRSREE